MLQSTADHDTFLLSSLSPSLQSNHNTVDSPLSDNGFWVLLQFAVRGRAMFHIGISEKMCANNNGHKIITEITSFMKLVDCSLYVGLALCS